MTYKMKQVCEQTGLTEKAVRLYVQKGLVQPVVEEGLHKNSITFTEKDIEELKQIAILRDADFSLAEIVTQDTGFDISFSVGKGVVPGADFSEQGRGGNWTFFMMLFNEIRFDNWFPLLQFTDEEDQIKAATIRYGLFKNTLKAGDTVEITYDDENQGIVYPTQAPWLNRKGTIYLTIGILLIAISALILPKAISAEKSPYYYLFQTPIDIMNPKLDILEGSIEQNENSLVIDYTRAKMGKVFSFYFHKGDIVNIQCTDQEGSSGQRLCVPKFSFAGDKNEDYVSGETPFHWYDAHRVLCLKDGWYEIDLGINDRYGIFSVEVETSLEEKDIPEE